MQRPGDERLRGSRLLTLRHLEELSQGELASRLEVSQGFISQVEKGAKPFPVDVARVACAAFGLPMAFFSLPLDRSETGVATFRKTSRASVRDENYVKALHGEAARLFRAASESSGYRSADLLDLALPDEEDAAAATRDLLGVSPRDPIPNATRALERLGVGVIHALAPLDSSRADHAGISRPSTANDRPLVATVYEQPPAVARMTLMHELGHLIYDQALTDPIRGTRAPEELRAYRFAGAMLVPAGVMRSRVTESLTLHGYLRIKADYGISVRALIKRASELRIISPTRARSLYIQHSSQGWQRAEPVAVATEEPRLVAQAVRRGLGNSAAQVAERSGVKEDLVARWATLEREPERTAKVIAFARARR